MKKSFFLLFSIAFCFQACKNHSRDYRSYQHQLHKLGNITFDNFSEYHSIDGCSRDDAQCTYVLVGYPKADLEKYKDAVKLNGQIKDEVLELLRPVSSNIAEDSIAVIANSFLDRYRSFKKEFPGSGQHWYLALIGDVAWQSTGFLTVKFTCNDYTGGAHPNHAVFYRVFDKMHGRVATLGDIVANMAKTRELAETKFRKLKNIAPSIPMAKTKFRFAQNTFSLNNNFGLDSAGLVFVYNPYEIAAYSEGATELRISYDELKGLLKPDVH